MEGESERVKRPSMIGSHVKRNRKKWWRIPDGYMGKESDQLRDHNTSKKLEIIQHYTGEVIPHSPISGGLRETFPALFPQNKIMRIWGGTISLGKHVRVVNSSEVRIFLQISWQFFFPLLFRVREATADEKQCKIWLKRYRSHTHQRALKGRCSQRL